LLRSSEGGYCLGGDSIRSMLAFSAARRSSESSLSDWSRAVETASVATSEGAVPGGGHAFTASDQRKSLFAVALWQFMHPVPIAAWSNVSIVTFANEVHRFCGAGGGGGQVPKAVLTPWNVLFVFPLWAFGLGGVVTGHCVMTS